MKKLIQHINDGKIELIDCPNPSIGRQEILCETKCSLISSGTERMLLDFGKSNFLQKALKQKDRVKDVFDKINTDGLIPTLEAVNHKLNTPIPLGYSNVGRVISVGSEVKNYQIGDRIVSNASHAEIVTTQKHLSSVIPDNVSDETASFTVIASIAMHGVRLANVTLGETVAVVGSGLIGLLTIQILRANGCNVIAYDYDKKKLMLAEKFGAQSFLLDNEGSGEKFALNHTKNIGVDKTIITASTKTSEPIKLASKITRKRGKIILVGVVDIHFDRSDLYEKEISFQVSCSYGPGRYDNNYENQGIDYPIGYVRWTEQRNFDAVLRLMSEGKIVTNDLLTERYRFNDVKKAYDSLLTSANIISILLEYSSNSEKKINDVVQLEEKSFIKTDPIISVVGCGNYAQRNILPLLKKMNLNLDTVISKEGLSGTINGKKFGFFNSSTNLEKTLNKSSSNTFFITTRHNLHSQIVNECLKKGKHIFCEKPLALSMEELNEIKENYKKSNSKIMIGFNRRFSTLTTKAKQLLKNCHSPKSFIFTFNSGFIPKDHWVHDRKIGGGRIIGEACHHIDLMRFLCGEKITKIDSSFLRGDQLDTAILTLKFEDGSIGCINYFSNGSKSHSKEDIKIFCEEKILHLDNFKALYGYGWNNFKKLKLFSQDKGQEQCLTAFIDSIKNGSQSPIPFDEIYEVSKYSLNAAKN